MGIKSYSVSLEEEVVIMARKKLKEGQKLSPIINSLLLKWAEVDLIKDEG